MSDTYTVRRATMDDVKDIHALLMENARKGLLLPRALIFLYGHVRNFLVIDDPRGGLAACCALAPVWEDLAEVCSLAVREDLRLQYRYLDLRRSRMYRNLRFRHAVQKAAQDYLDADGMRSFMETMDSVKATKADSFELLFDPTLVRGMS